MKFSPSLLFWSAAAAQQVYVPSVNPTSQPYCNSVITQQTIPTGSPTYKTSAFSFTLTETTRTASSVTAPPRTTHGLPCASVSSLFANVSTTTWGNWYPNGTKPTDTANPYGNAAFSSLWNNLPSAIVANFTRGIYSTTVSPTPIPTSELILPPPLFYGPQDCYEFLEDFVFGAAASAAQVEGAVADEGKSPSTNELRTLVSKSIPAAYLEFVYPDGQVVDDFSTVENYYLYQQDIERLAAVGMKYFSFSIAWTRILPFVVPGSPVNEQGLKHYDDLINFIIAKGMTSVVTLLHYDTPLQFFGTDPVVSLLSRSYTGGSNQGYQSSYENVSFEDSYAHYGKIVMAHFADRVPIWISFNEPLQACVSGPSIDAVIKSHARLHHFYHEVLQGNGKMSLKLGATPGLAQDPTNSTHLAAVQRYNDLGIGVFLNPLALGKDYPDAVKETWQDYVPLSQYDLEYVNGTLDFVAADLCNDLIIVPVFGEAGMKACGLNNASTNSLYPTCVETSSITVNNWSFAYHPDYLMWATTHYVRAQLGYLWNTYGKPIVVSEFGQPSVPRLTEQITTLHTMSTDPSTTCRS